MTIKYIYRHTNRLIAIIILLGLAFTILSCINGVSADPSIIYVNDSSGNDSWDGQYAEWQIGTTSGPKKSIKSGVSTVNDSGTVNIANGNYGGPENDNIYINKDMTIKGQSKEGTIINRGYAYPFTGVFTIASGKNVKIQDLTIAGGKADYGGAIYNNGTLTVNNSIFTGNTAIWHGGAIYNKGTLIIDSSTFTGNTANYHGGAIFNLDGTLTVKNSVFTDNCVGNGVDDCQGGAISNNNGALDIINSTFTGNTASSGAYGEGGAIFNWGGALNVKSSNFENNTATHYGGAIYVYSGPLTVQFCRIVGNTPQDIYSQSSPINAEDNWWGTNFEGTNPVTAGRVGGPKATVSTWLLLEGGLNPTATVVGSTSPIYANLWYDQNVYHDPANGHVPDGIEAKFTSSIESIDPSSNTMANGYAVSFFTPRAPGTANITVTVDNQQFSFQVVVLKAPTNLSMNDVSGVNGETVNITATLTDNSNNPLSGKIINFSVDGTNIGSATTSSDGKATINYTITQTVGDHTITAEFAGDNEYEGKTGEGKLTVNKKQPNLVINNVNGVNGETVNMTATLTDNSNNPLAGKTINFSVDGTNIGSAITGTDGKATINYTITQTVGDHTITAEFTGDDVYEGKTGTGNLNVDKIQTDLVINDLNGVNGETVNITATLTDYNNNPLSGKIINFSVDGTNIGSATTGNDGKATISYKPNSVGNYTINAGFAGDNEYGGKTGEGNLKVDKLPTNLVINNSSVNGGTANVTVTLTDNNNDPLVGKTINFSINGVSIGNVITNSNGKATISYKLNGAGDYTIIAGFVEDDGYLSSQNEVTLHVDPSSDNSQSQINSENSGTNPKIKNSENTVKAAIKTVKMQETGIPIAGLILAILMVFSGLAMSKK